MRTPISPEYLMSETSLVGERFNRGEWCNLVCGVDDREYRDVET